MSAGAGRPGVGHALDLLLLHDAAHKHVARYIEAIAKSLGLTAASIFDLPFKGKSQDQKVDYHIKQAHLVVVILTSSSESERRISRPNLYDEISRSRKLKKRLQLLILQEVLRDGTKVEMPSNIAGDLPVLPFDSSQLQELVPSLLDELRALGLFAPVREREEHPIVKAGSILNSFLDRMDELWDNEFDIAWLRIHRSNYSAETNFALRLDRFFQEYQKVFSALIRDKKRGADLEAVCATALAESRKLAAEIWEIVAEAKIQQVEAYASSGEDKTRDLRYQEATVELRKAKKSDGPESSIANFKKVADLVDAVLSAQSVSGRPTTK